jgi:hypothetical protein
VSALSVAAGWSSRRWGASAAALSLYAIGSLALQFHGLEHLASGCACYGTDPTQYMWSLAWWPHALLHGLNPLSSHVIWAPGGMNTAANTTTPVPALLAWPVTALFGPVVAYNLLSLIAPVLSGWCAYRLCVYLTGAPAASIAGGWLYGFSAFAVTQMMGHLHLVFTFAAPLLILLSLRLADGAISRRRFVCFAALTLLAQLGTGTELLFTTTCAGAVLLGAVALFATPADRRRLVALIPPLVLAYVVMAVIGAPFLYDALRGPKLAVGWGATFSADLLSFAVPTQAFWVGGHKFLPVSQAFTAGFVETGTYLGVPLIAICGAYAVSQWRLVRTRALIASAAVAALFALGGTLMIDGHPTVALPFRLISGLPVFDQLLPARLGLFVELGAAVAAALWLAAPGRLGWLRWALVVLAAVLLLPRADGPLYDTRLVVPSFFTSGSYRHQLHRGEIVLPLPFGDGGSSLLWQAQTGMYFSLASGSFEQPAPAEYLRWPAMGMLLGGPPAKPTPAQAQQLDQFLTAHHVGAVIAQGDQAQPWQPLLALAGLHGRATGGVELYRVPAHLP